MFVMARRVGSRMHAVRGNGRAYRLLALRARVGDVERKAGEQHAADQVAERDGDLVPQPPVAPVLTLAPIIIPAGMTNMLTTECSKPCAKKMKIGIQAPAILPIVEWRSCAITTPRQTIQLHSTALTKTVTIPATPKCA